jgi:cyclic pyranopterin phosphate synthase
MTTTGHGLSDAYGRRISYLRLSVTDRCDLRCRYCMAETMQFMARRELLTFDEMMLISERLVARGIRKIRLTGGEPLTRRGLPEFAQRLGALIKGGRLEELTLTTNGTRLAEHASALVAAGIRRVNVSLDTLDPTRFRDLTRLGNLDRVLSGIAAARTAGLHVKINMVALRNLEDEIVPMLRWCGTQGHDLTLIETMPLGVVEEDRTDRYLPLDGVRRSLENQFTLLPIAHRTGGPARYFSVEELGVRLGLITPMTNNFCEGCTRIRLTADGQLYACLGHEGAVDLKRAFRDEGGRARRGSRRCASRQALAAPFPDRSNVAAKRCAAYERHRRLTPNGTRNRSAPTMNPETTAVLFIEYQNDFVSEGGAQHDAVVEVMRSTDMLTNSRALLDAARQAGLVVLHAPIKFADGYPEMSTEPYGVLAGIKAANAFREGSWGANFAEAMCPTQGEIVVEGKR